MFFNEEKNIAFFNKQQLDTYHEIVVSFDYARYNRSDIPTGGFSIMFFNANNKKPIGGGPGFALGYLPSSQTDYCKLDGYKGLNGAVLGVGFDLNGAFALPGENYNGLPTATPNSVTVRMGVENEWRHVATSKNFLNTPVGIKIADKIGFQDQPEYKSVRVVITKGFTNIKVQIKRAEDRNFYTVLETSIPIKDRDAVRVALASTVSDDTTEFDIKNFNVMGYPGIPKEQVFTDCIQNINLGGYFYGQALVAEEDFVAVPVEGKIFIYKLIDNKFVNTQTLSDTEKLKLLGGSNKFLITNIENTTQIVIFYYNQDVFFRLQDFNLTEDSLISENEADYFFDVPICADTDNEFLAIGNGSQVVTYFYTFNPNASNLGIFQPTGQTIIEEVSGGLGISVQVENDKMLVGGSKNYVQFFTYDGTDFILQQTIFDPTTGNPYSRFGSSLSLQRNDLIIGSPHAYKTRYNTVGQGEAYHYYYSINRQTNNREWKRIMNIGNFFRVDSPGGEFGDSVKLAGNNLLVGAPYENYLNPPNQSYENLPNCGRVYFFRKTPSGLFTRGVAVAPDPDQAMAYSFYGKHVGFFKNDIGVSITTYTPGGKNSEMNLINKNCLFDKPPDHLPIDFSSIALVDNAGYMIDIETLTYMQLLCATSAYG